MRINSSVNKLTRRQRHQIIKFALQYCMDVFGYNSRKKRGLSIVITDEENTINFGEYRPCINEIRVYYKNTKDICKFIETFVHEYTHSLQPCRTKYMSLLEEYGYNNHPFEIEARRVASEHKKIIWKKFLKSKKK